jgi:hypothetical protein
MSARIKPHKVKGRQLEEVREKDPDGRAAARQSRQAPPQRRRAATRPEGPVLPRLPRR